MRRIASLIALAALAACNPSAPSGEQGAADVFPDLFQTAYRAEGTMTNTSTGETMPVVMIRDGQKMRMEMSSSQGSFAVINNPELGESIVLTNAGGRPMAIRASGQNFSNPAADWNAQMGATMTATGPCTGAGQTGSQWSGAKEDGTPQTVCVTGDGIVLQATEGGQTTWETTSVARGPQDAALFTLPPGVSVFDANAAMSEAMAKMKAAQGGQGQ